MNSSTSPRILIVEDEPAIADTLAFALQRDGFATTIHSLGRKGIEALATDRFALIILDVGLPDMTGFDVCREIRRASEIPVIFLTARSDEVDRIVGLELGADDYVCKPFNRRELLARVKNLLRRTAAMRQFSRRVVHFAGFTFDTAARHVTRDDGAGVQLTRAEYELLRTFVLNPGVVLSRDRLQAGITNRHGFSGSRTVDVMIKRLRAKFGDDPKLPRIFGTSHGEGYVFTAPLS